MVMKLNVTLDLDDLWLDNEQVGQYILQEIKDSISAEVRREVRAAVKDVLADYHKEIKASAKQYAAKVTKTLLEEAKR